ncbi:MAG: omega-6 fatty acid desaturase (delta-12 desaturase) [Polaribacter sp.]|jgi:omega-6 fatty acid desaturase (delta-12 desaturase)
MNTVATTIDKHQEIKAVLKNWPKIVERYQQPNSKKAVIQILNSFLPFLAIWGLMYWSLTVNYWLTLALAILNAFFLVRIFIIQHDCGHQSFLNSKEWNNRIGFICSFISLIPYQYWAKSHNFHHAHNGELEVRDIGDVDLFTVEEYKALPKGKRLKYRIYRTPIVMFLIGPLYYLLIHNRFPFIKMKGWEVARHSLRKSNVLLVSFYIGMGFLLGWKSFLMVQAPIVVFFAIIAIWFFYVQHQHEESYKQWKENWEYLLSAIQGSTYYKLPRVFQWLTGNIGIHHIHHLSALIPNYNLEKCNKENPILEKYVTVLSFRSSLECIGMKLWDEDRQKMISFNEFDRMEKQGLVG